MSQYTASIQALYVAYFNRPADPSGLAYWELVVAKANGNTAAVSAEFAKSPEYKAAYAGLSDDAVINQVYMNIFGRQVDSQGLNFWSPKLTAHLVSIDQIVTEVAKGAQGSDATTYNNRVTASVAYTDALNADVSLRLAYSNAAAITSAKAFLNGITTDVSLTAAIAPAALAANLAQMVIDAAPVGSTFTLTTGIDNFIGTASNDTINGTALTGLDNVNGGAGTDKLNISSTTAITTAGATVSNVEVANLTSALDVNANVSAWTGLNSLNVVSAATGAETITAGTATAVRVGNSTAFAVNVAGSGGALVVSNDVGGAINVGQGAVANAITSAAITGGSVNSINDASGTAGATGSTLKTVSVTAAGGATTFTGNGINSLTVASSSQNVSVVAAAATRTLGVTLNTVTAGTITDGTATTVNVTSTGAANVVADLAVAAATSVTLAGDKALTLTTTHLGAATALTVSDSALVTISGYVTTNKLGTVTVTGAGGLTTDLSAQGTQLTTIDASASTGTNTVTINGTEIYKGGAGNDIVTAAVSPTVAVTGGAGSDTFVVNAAAFALTNVSGFETLGAGALATGSYSAAGFAHLTEGAVTGAITWNTVAAGTDLTITASTTAATTYTLATDTATDALAVTLKSSGAIAGNSLTATNVETVAITLADTNTTKHVDTLTLVDTALTTLTVGGNAGLVLTNTSTTLTSVDASAMTNTAGTAATGFSWTSGILAAASTIRGSATGGDVIDATAATAKVTITEVAGTNSITGSSTIGSSLTGGTGADAIFGGAGADIIVGGGGADSITGGAGADLITVSGVTAAIVQAAGASGANTSTTIQTAELTSTFDVIKGFAAGDTINLGNTAIVAGNVNLAGANLAAGAADTVVFASGTYDAAAGTFTYAANGADTAVTYDSNVAAGVTAETIILVGYHAGAGTVGAAGIITLA